MIRALVTGATGFIGSQVAAALAARGDDVHALTRQSSSRSRSFEVPGLTWHTANLQSTRAIRSVVREIRPDAVVHLAWFAVPGRYLHDRHANLRSLEIAVKLLDVLADEGCPRVVLTGTGLEATAPATIYSATKSAAHAIAAQLRSNGLSATCAHVFYVYGPGEDRRRLVPSVIQALLRGERVSVGRGTEARDYLHVSDVAKAICCILDGDPGPTVDICSGRAIQVRQVLRLIGQAIGQSELIRYGERAVEAFKFPSTGDPSWLLNAGWQPVVALPDGIRDTIKYWAAQMESDGNARLS